MQKSNRWYLVIMLLIIGLVVGLAFNDTPIPSSESSSSPTENEATSLEAFDQMMQVIAHKRCVNCHPAGDQPHQGEDSHLHRFDVQRGVDGHGLAALKCSACHQEENNQFSGVPGAPHWHLAPRSMGWEGLNRVEIAQAMTDPARNGGRTIKEIEEHLTEDPLVLWVFEPGVDHEGNPREKPPISKEAYITAVKEWVENGAIIPEK